MRFTPSLAIAILALSPSSLARVFNGAADTFDPSVVNFIAVANFGADVINVNLTKVLNAPGDSAGCLAFAKGMQGLSDKLENWADAFGHARHDLDNIAAGSSSDSQIISWAKQAITALQPGGLAINDVVNGTIFKFTPAATDASTVLKSTNDSLAIVAQMVKANTDPTLTATLQFIQSNLTVAQADALDGAALASGKDNKITSSGSSDISNFAASSALPSDAQDTLNQIKTIALASLGLNVVLILILVGLGIMFLLQRRQVTRSSRRSFGRPLVDPSYEAAGLSEKDADSRDIRYEDRDTSYHP